MNQLPTTDEFSESQITDLVASFYQQVRGDDLIGPMYPNDDWVGAEARLRDFLIYRFGGSDKYIQQRGHPRLRMRHAPFVIDAAARDRWLELMDNAIKLTRVPEETAEKLQMFFRQVADFMRNR